MCRMCTIVCRNNNFPESYIRWYQSFPVNKFSINKPVPATIKDGTTNGILISISDIQGSLIAIRFFFDNVCDSVFSGNQRKKEHSKRLKNLRKR